MADKINLNNPFFIVGCVRSGTTFLRNALRNHPNLASPEETHFFRWTEPFGAGGSLNHLMNNPVLKKHRSIDRITEDEFSNILHKSVNRAQLTKKYMLLYMQKNKPEAIRFFDKTPQNIYGAAMIATQFPRAKFVHIVRNPLDVASSLRIGRVIKVENLIGACNYWLEAVQIIQVLKRAFPKRIYELRYEDLTENFSIEIEKLSSFLNENYKKSYFKNVKINRNNHEIKELFDATELSQINKFCGKIASSYGYDLSRRIKGQQSI